MISENVIRADEETDGAGVPRIEFGEWIDNGFRWFEDQFATAISWFNDTVHTLTTTLADTLLRPDALVLTAIFTLIALLVANWKVALLSLVMFLFVISVEQWDNAMATLALILVATAIALIIGIPLGILAARSSAVSNAVRPVMDLLQTMPALVWLVPVVIMFGARGFTAAVVATLIFCLPPAVRLTELGIRQVDSEVVEAGHAFGSTKFQILRRIQLPLALPSIMAGINQVIMLALSMAVIAGYVGAGGLGGEVASAIGRLDMALGFEAGLSVVVLAIYLDRVTSAVSHARTGRTWSSRIRQAVMSKRGSEAYLETSVNQNTQESSTVTSGGSQKEGRT